MQSTKEISKPILDLQGLVAGYGPIEVLKGVSLTVRRGELVTVIGANGAGKTTLLMCISRILRIRQGKMIFNGEEITASDADVLVRRGLIQVPEGRKIFPRMTVKENLELGAFLRKDEREIAADLQYVYSLFPLLGQRERQLGGTLSGGEQQMLAIGRALMSKPKLLLLDEPSMGVAPILTSRIFQAISDLNKRGISILLVEQNAHLALKLADRGYVLNTGKVEFEDESERLLVDPRVTEAYLGA